MYKSIWQSDQRYINYSKMQSGDIYYIYINIYSRPYRIKPPTPPTPGPIAPATPPPPPPLTPTDLTSINS